MKNYLFIVLLFVSFSGFGQHTLNHYKYVLVPEKFNFLKEKNQYDLNMQAMSLLENKGFLVYYDNSQLPSAIANNRCQALFLELLEKNSMFSTNLTIILKDCKGNEIFKGKEGKSREKEYKVSYNFALREAFKSLNEMNYSYQEPPAAQEQVPAAIVPATTVPAIAAAPQASAVETGGQSLATLYAQPTATGFQLVDASPKIILSLFKTSVENYFIAQKGTTNGIVFNRNNNWILEYYDNGKLMAETLTIKF